MRNDGVHPLLVETDRLELCRVNPPNQSLAVGHTSIHRPNSCRRDTQCISATVVSPLPTGMLTCARAAVQNPARILHRCEEEFFVQYEFDRVVLKVKPVVLSHGFRHLSSEGSRRTCLARAIGRTSQLRCTL